MKGIAFILIGLAILCLITQLMLIWVHIYMSAIGLNDDDKYDILIDCIFALWKPLGILILLGIILFVFSC